MLSEFKHCALPVRFVLHSQGLGQPVPLGLLACGKCRKNSAKDGEKVLPGGYISLGGILLG